MSCERFEGETVDVAAGRPPSPGIEAHLEGCPACRALVDQQRRLLGEVDRVLGARLSAEPSPALAERVAARLADAEARGRRRPVWVGAMAAGLGAAILAGWIARRPLGDDSTGPGQGAASTPRRPPENAPSSSPAMKPARTTPVEPRPRAVAARVVPAAPRRAAARGAGADRAEPLVLVPSGQEDALRRFVASLRHGAQPVPPLLVSGTSVAGTVETPPLLEIPAVSVEPLSDPAVSPERSQR